MRVLMLAMILTLTACKSLPAPVEVRTVDVVVETQVPLDGALTAQVAAPKRPANRCSDSQGRSTLCNRDMADWLNAYATALSKANGQLKAIMGLQPEAKP